DARTWRRQLLIDYIEQWTHSRDCKPAAGRSSPHQRFLASRSAPQIRNEAIAQFHHPRSEPRRGTDCGGEATRGHCNFGHRRGTGNGSPRDVPNKEPTGDDRVSHADAPNRENARTALVGRKTKS